MHPILSKKGPFRLYVILWLAAGLLAALAAAIVWQIEWAFVFVFTVPMAILYGFISLSAYYLCRSFPLGHTGTAQAILVVSGVSIASSALWVFAGSVIYWFIGQAILSTTPKEPPTLLIAILFGSGVLLYVLSAAVYYLQAESEKRIDTERRIMEMNILARDAELRALRAQIDPHFFFNSLNSISAMTTRDPAGARQMIVLLSEFFRKTIQVGSYDTIPLKDELNLVAAYLDIEKIRFAERMRVTYDRDPMAEEICVPPLILQPLVENAVKHGIAEIIHEGTIVIQTHLDDDILQISIENPVDEPLIQKESTNTGIKNVADRINGAFGGSGRLDTACKDGIFRVDVSIPVYLKEQ